MSFGFHDFPPFKLLNVHRWCDVLLGWSKWRGVIFIELQPLPGNAFQPHPQKRESDCAGITKDKFFCDELAKAKRREADGEIKKNGVATGLIVIATADGKCDFAVCDAVCFTSQTQERELASRGIGLKKHRCDFATSR
ncbi:MAG: hypothetical protein ACKVZH_28295 [Blastocatellia bacterium]